MTWAQCLKRAFDIDIETCPACGGVRIMPKALAALAGQALACIKDREVIEKILTHLGGRGLREKRAGEPVAGVDPGAVRSPRGDWRVGASADRRCRDQ